MPAAELLTLRSADTDSLVGRALTLSRSEELAKTILEDSLFDAIGSTPINEELRRKLIKARRAVRTGRRSSARAEIATLPPELSGVRSCAAQWDELSKQAEAVLSSADTMLESDIHRFSNRLLEIASEYDVLRSIVTAAPALARQLYPNGKARRHLSRKELGILLSYVIRTALKPSPFGGFTHVGLLPIDVDNDSNFTLKALQTYTISQVSRSLLARISNSTPVEWTGSDVLEVNPFLRVRNGRVRSLSRSYDLAGVLPWRSERLSNLNLNENVLNLLNALRPSAPARTFIAALIQMGLNESRASALLSKFVESGVLLRAFKCDALDVDVSSDRWIGKFATIVDRGQVYSSASCASRLSILEAVSQAVATKPENESRSCVTEAGYAVLRDTVLGKEVRDYVADLAIYIDQAIIKNPFHDRMATVFQERFGHGGTCNDLIDFFYDVDDSLLEQPIRLDLAKRPQSEYRLPATIFGQVAKRYGQSKLILSKINPFIGGLSARHLGELAKCSPSALAEYAEWLRVGADGEEPVDVPVCGEVQDLQVHPRLTERILAWPVEPISDTREKVYLSDLSLSWDPETNEFVIRDVAGKKIRPFYLGAVFAHAGWGPLYHLITLSHPYILRYIDASPIDANAEQPSIVRHAQIERGNVIFARRRWSVQTEHLKTRWFAHTGARRLLDIQRDLEANELPDQFFARVSDFDEGVKWLYIGNLRKPMWFDTKNPYSLDLLERLAETGRALDIVETTPSPFGGGWDPVERVFEVQIEVIFRGKSQ